jgi:KUP system potassium uptake protein
MISCIALVIAFRASAHLAAAYGLAVVGTMCISSLLFFFIAKERWHWKTWQAGGLTALFLSFELALLGANLVKLLHGAWLPLVMGTIMYTLMSTWKRGRAVLSEQLRERSLPLDLFLADVAKHPERRVAGTAVFMTGAAEGIPPALLHNLKHNKVVHRTVVLLTIITEEIPTVPKERRVEVIELGEGFHRVVAHYGFTQDPAMNDILAAARANGLALQTMDTSFYLGRDTVIATKKRAGLARWRKALFVFMGRNARSATAFFGIPPNRVVELGAQIEI